MGILTDDMKRLVEEQKLAFHFKGLAVIHEPGSPDSTPNPETRECAILPALSGRVAHSFE